VKNITRGNLETTGTNKCKTIMSFLHRHEKIAFRLIEAVLRLYDLRKAVSDAIKNACKQQPTFK